MWIQLHARTYASDVPIPDHDSYGFLPAGIYDCTLTELNKRFGRQNTKRKAIGKGLLSFRSWLEGFGLPGFLYIDGSYITAKDRPGDVDVVVVLPEDPLRAAAFLRAYDRAEIKRKYHVDCLKQTSGPGGDFKDLFQRLRLEVALDLGLGPDFRKGILRVPLTDS